MMVLVNVSLGFFSSVFKDCELKQMSEVNCHGKDVSNLCFPCCITDDVAPTCATDILFFFFFLCKTKCNSQDFKTDSEIFSKVKIPAFVCTSLIDLKVFISLLHIFSQGQSSQTGSISMQLCATALMDCQQECALAPELFGYLALCSVIRNCSLT